MTFDQWLNQILTILPDATVSEDADGQLIVNTGLQLDGEIVVEMENV